jgi:hypothetical protein
MGFILRDYQMSAANQKPLGWSKINGIPFIKKTLSQPKGLFLFQKRDGFLKEFGGIFCV